MTDSWTDSNGGNLPSDWTPGGPLTPADEWGSGCGCAPPDAPAIAKGVLITGRPATIQAMPWQITLNDGGAPANFTIDHYDALGVLIESPIAIEGSSGDVMLTHDPTQPLGAATKDYVDTHGGSIQEPPDNQTYGRTNGAWNLVVPQSGGTFGGQVNLGGPGGVVGSNALVFAGSAVCHIPTIAQLALGGGSLGQVPATDGSGNLSWVTPVTGGPYVPISGATMTGPLIMQGSNMIALNSPINAGQSAILGQKAGLNRWQLMIGDYTAEGAGNAGSNFTLNAYNVTGGLLGAWLTIARADGATNLNGAAVNVAGSMSINGVLLVSNVGNLSIPGGTAGQFLETNGAGVLSWATPAGGGGGVPEAPTDSRNYARYNATWNPVVSFPEAPGDGQYYARRQLSWQVVPTGGISDAPNDGTAYARKSAAWAHLAHTDITDWTATLAPYALTTAVPVASTSTPLMDGTAAVGTSLAFARGDHVHPTDTSRAAVTALPPASTVTPLADGVAAVGTSAAYARADHVHPVVYMGENRLINGNFAVNQRAYASGTALPSSPTVANGYGHDRWKAGAAGCTYTFTAALPDTTITITAGTLTQIIEAGMIEGGVYTLSWTGTAQARVYQGTPSGSYAASPVTTASLTAGTNTVVEFNTGTMTRAKLENGSVATPFPRQSLAKSFADCQRYYRVRSSYQPGGVSNSNSVQWGETFPVIMRAAPTIALSMTGGNGYSAQFAALVTVDGFTTGFTGTATLYLVNVSWTALAEL